MTRAPGPPEPWWYDGPPSPHPAPPTPPSRTRRPDRRALLVGAGVLGAVAIAGTAWLLGGADHEPRPGDDRTVAGVVGPTASPTRPAELPTQAPSPTTSATAPALPTPDASPTTAPAPSPTSEPVQPSAPTALDVAQTLVVKGRAPMTGYDRDLFGVPWTDVDRNGCDTRNDILRRDLQDVEIKPRTQGCVVLSGVLDDPYTGELTRFQRGSTTSVLVQIDHVVALGDAWQKGAQQWSADTRLQFANDPLNLLAVDGQTNQQKGAGDVATWLPPDRSGWCEYAARVVAVKARYSVWVTEAEKNRLLDILSGCSGEPLPDGGP